jgi:hypothetical protein
LFKLLVPVFTFALVLGASATPAQAPANDALTGIPVFPSAGGDDDRIPGQICHAKSQTAVYLVRFQWGPNHTAAAKQIEIADVEQWYQSRLKDFRFLAGSDGQRSQDVFLSVDGTKAVTITGNPAPSKQAFAISFTLFSEPVQPAQVKSFATNQKVSC